MTTLSYDNGWVALSYIADLLRDDKCEVYAVPRTTVAGAGPTSFTLCIDKIAEGDAENVAKMISDHHDAEETAQWGERMMIRWAEYGAAANREREFPEVAKKFACPTCLAHVGAWCMPTHDGERPSRDWVHPARGSWTGLDGEVRAHPRASEAARVVIQHQPYIRRPNGARYSALAILAETVLAYERRIAHLTGAPQPIHGSVVSARDFDFSGIRPLEPVSTAMLEGAELYTYTERLRREAMLGAMRYETREYLVADGLGVAIEPGDIVWLNDQRHVVTLPTGVRSIGHVTAIRHEITTHRHMRWVTVSGGTDDE